MADAARQDEQFRRAVSAIDAGDLDTLRRLLAAHPAIVSDRLEAPGQWLRDKLQGALDGFFSKPYLLWFIAEDPVRTGQLPSNIVEITQLIVDTARALGVQTLQMQLDETLRLVSWSGVAARCGVQLALIDTLVEAGASPRGNPNNALVNGHIAAAERLLHWGAPITLGAAICLDRWDDATRLAAEASDAQRQFAFVLAALNGKATGVKWMTELGVPLNRPSEDLYPHGTPLHHAVCSGSLETVRVLVDAGADVNALDSAWQGTPLGWAEYYEESASPERRADYAAIVTYLRERVGVG